MSMPFAPSMENATPAHRRIRYRAKKTTARFHHNRARVRGIRGPVGSGKSVACAMEVWRMAMSQAPTAEGVRRSRFAIIRNTFGELRSTTIKTWQEWIPDDICPIVYDSPIRGMLKVPHPDGVTTVESEILFLALDKPKDVKKLLSLELTGAWINEAREIPWSIVLAVRQRIGRYPRKDDAPITQVSLLMDTNPPDTDHWWYQAAEEHRMPNAPDESPPLAPKDFTFFAQPPALLKLAGAKYLPNPEAENVENQQLGYSYWVDQIPGATAEWIKVYLLGQYGFVLDGKLVYPEYRDDIHCRPVRAIQGLPLLLGWDFGLTPACIVGQLTPRGALHIIDEFVSEDMGIEQFASEVVKPQLALRYPAWKLRENILSAGDPAGNDPAQTDETTCFQVLKELGFVINGGGRQTNEFLPRRTAVARFLTRMDRGVPSYVLDPGCKWLRKGFLGGYHYRRMQVPGKMIYRDEPDKDAFSHPHDAQQYLAQMAAGSFALTAPAIAKTAEEQDREPPRRNRGRRVSLVH